MLVPLVVMAGRQRHVHRGDPDAGAQLLLFPRAASYFKLVDPETRF